MKKNSIITVGILAFVAICLLWWGHVAYKSTQVTFTAVDPADASYASFWEQEAHNRQQYFEQEIVPDKERFNEEVDRILQNTP